MRLDLALRIVILLASVMDRKITSLLTLLALLSLNFGMRCGSPGDVDAAECCASNPACHNDGGMSSPEACCRKERNSRALGVFQWVAASLQVGSKYLAVLPTQIPQTVPLSPVSSNQRDRRGAPLKPPPRDLVKLNAIFLI